MNEALPSKGCFKCGEVKTLSDFYKHPMMADGHVNKCKECNKKDVHKNRADNIDYVREYDRTRRKKENVTEERWEELSTKRKAYAEAYYDANPDKWEERLAKRRKESFTPEDWAAEMERRKEFSNKYPEKVYERTKKYREDFPKKYKAHAAVGYAIRGGALVPQPCEVCGEMRVHGHHVDYDKPLEVMWLCAEHHWDWHRLHGEGLNGN